MNLFIFTLQYCIGFAIYQNVSTTGIRVLHPGPPFLLPPVPSLWLVSVHQPQASSIMHSTATAAAESLQLYLILCDPIDGSPPGSSIPGILQARTLEWAAISFSNA